MSVNFPFLIIFDKDKIALYDDTRDFFNCDSYQYYSNNHNYQYYSNQVGYFTPYSDKCLEKRGFSSKLSAYSIGKSEIKGNLKYTIFPSEEKVIDIRTFEGISSKMRISIIPKRITLYLIPIIDNFEDCEASSSSYIQDICKKANIKHIATLNNNTDLCYLWKDSSYEESCILEVAFVNNNLAACELIGELNGPVTHINNCKRKIATRTLNQSLCESIPNSFWRFTSSYNVGNDFYPESWDCYQENPSLW
ncbi:MAG: hypothetical protein AABW91_03760 [Nanoarchaeota archaeon]